MTAYLRDTARAAARRAGFRFLRLRDDPLEWLCGIRGLPIRTIIDAGANRGQSALHFARLFEQARIHSFEPVPQAHAALLEVARASDGRITAHHAALGEQAGTMPMNVHVDHETSSSLLPTTSRAAEIYPFVERQRPIEVPVWTLDGWAGLLGDPLRDDLLVKLDVQGYESRVIGGGARTLGQARAVICEISLMPLYEGQPGFLELAHRFADLGLEFAGCQQQFLDPEGRVIFVDAAFLRHP